MKRLFSALVFLGLFCIASVHGTELELRSPLDYQVIQRQTKDSGTVRIVGMLSDEAPKNSFLEIKWSEAEQSGDWKRVDSLIEGRDVSAFVQANAGGWKKLEIRIASVDAEIARATVEHVGIGEVFVIAGQSNSANYGEGKLQPQSGLVVAFDGLKWQIADDPQPRAHGSNGSFVPAFGDALVAKINVPVGIVACGVGGTSVREWLPKGSQFSNPPTIENRVTKDSDGQWTSKGEAYNTLIGQMKELGPRGFRAVLWHQGESDANQKDPSRTLPGNLYRQYLEKIILDSRRDVGWDAPWVVAQATYHVPGDESSPDIRAAQASLWQDGIAEEGPDSDMLKGELRERDGQGVHFSVKGLKAHGEAWAEKVATWLITSLED